jgi:low affinity Fe/Cu permease
LRATQVAAVNIWPSLIEEFRAIADKADERLRRDDISPDEFVALRHRSNLVEAKVIALEEEIRGAAEDLVHRLARRPQ